MLLATRLLSIRARRGNAQVPVAMQMPEAGPDGGWLCRFSIGWPDEERRGEGWGADAFQALHLTLERIGLELYASPYHAAGELVWLEPGDGYGFPVPPNVRAQLVGADRHLSGPIRGR